MVLPVIDHPRQEGRGRSDEVVSDGSDGGMERRELDLSFLIITDVLTHFPPC